MFNYLIDEHKRKHTEIDSSTTTPSNSTKKKKLVETKAKTPTPKSSTLKQSDKKTNSLKKKDTVSSEPEILYKCNFNKDDLNKMWYGAKVFLLN